MSTSGGLQNDLADGPPLGQAPDPMTIPDAEPRIEPIVLGGANKPYEVAGRAYVPVTVDKPITQRGMASWYGRKFHGRPTASGEPYNMFAMSAAHTTMPIPSYAVVRNPANGREVVVKVNDRGPFAQERIMDLSWAAASKLGIAGQVSMVEVQRLTNVEIQARTGGRSAVPVAVGSGANMRITPLPTPPRPAVVAGAPVAQPPARTPAAAPAPVHTAAASGHFWVQFGAFSKSEGAQSLQREVAGKFNWLSSLLTVLADDGLHRLQAGPYKTREEARDIANRIKGESTWLPMLVERR